MAVIVVAPLTMPAQLGAFMKETISDADPSALLILDIATGMVRDYLEMQGWALEAVADDVVLVDPIDGAYLFLDGLPITAVTLVEIFDGTTWSTADPATYTVSKRLGIISALPGLGVRWPTKPETWRVTYDHGMPAVPSGVLGVILGVAARQWNGENGVDSERVGGYQVKYAMEAGGFSGTELKALAKYMNPRIA